MGQVGKTENNSVLKHYSLEKDSLPPTKLKILFEVLRLTIAEIFFGRPHTLGELRIQLVIGMTVYKTIKSFRHKLIKRLLHTPRKMGSVTLD